MRKFLYIKNNYQYDPALAKEGNKGFNLFVSFFSFFLPDAYPHVTYLLASIPHINHIHHGNHRTIEVSKNQK